MSVSRRELIRIRAEALCRSCKSPNDRHGSRVVCTSCRDKNTLTQRLRYQAKLTRYCSLCDCMVRHTYKTCPINPCP